MKMRDLIRQAGSVTVPAWPPQVWSAASFTSGAALPMPGDGVLESVSRIESTVLRLTMRFEANEYTGLLSWDGPPILSAVVSLLNANRGRAIRVIGDLHI